MTETPASTTDLLTMSWPDRLRLVARNIRRMVRTGAQTTLTGLALSDATPVNAFDIDLGLGVGFFAGGCVIWLLTTLAAPPRE